ncbi:MAG TPA: class I tRNA ligase family protein, partial [Chloroflexota bacterium]
PWNAGGPWNPQGIAGIERFLSSTWSIVLDGSARADGNGPADDEIERLLHKTTRRVTEDLERFRFNTHLAALMELVNALIRLRSQISATRWQEASQRLTLMLAPSAPHMAEELWHRLGHSDSVHLQDWPSYDEELTVDPQVMLIVQVNGKVRDRIEAPVGVEEEEAKRLALASSKVQPFVENATIRQVIYVPGRLVNLVTG